MTKLSDIEQKIVDLHNQVIIENERRNAVKEGKEFVEFARLAGLIAQQQQELLDEVPNSLPELNELKAEALELFKEQGIKEFGRLFAKTTAGEFVNVERVLSALDGDIDNFVTLCSITNKALKDKIKELKDTKKPENKILADDLKHAIEKKPETITDILIA